jgi:GTPase SAR1 family protein
MAQYADGGGSGSSSYLYSEEEDVGPTYDKNIKRKKRRGRRTTSAAAAATNIHSNYAGVEDNEEPMGHFRHNRPSVAVLIIGRSDSGKTVLSRALIREFSSREEDVVEEDAAPADEKKLVEEKVYALNDRSSHCPYEKIGWNQALEIRNASVIVEDVIGATRSQFAILQEMINYRQHHRGVNCVIVIAHTATSNNIFGLISNFHYIFFAAMNSSLDSLRKVLNKIGFRKREEHEQYENMIKNCAEKFCHLRIDVERHEGGLTRVGQRESLLRKRMSEMKREGEKHDIRANANKYLEDLAHAKKALLLFDHIYPKLPRGSVDPNFLIVSLRTHNRGAKIRLSLVDYLAALTDDDPSSAASSADPILIKFHAYLQKRGVFLPRTYVLNPRYW